MSTSVSPALEELASAMGGDAVLTSDEDLREFRDPLAFEKMPAPTNVRMKPASMIICTRTYFMRLS